MNTSDSSQPDAGVPLGVPTALPPGLPQGYPYRAEDETTPRELRALRESPDSARVLILDVRTKAEWDICHLQGATLLPLQQLEQRMEDLKDDLDRDLTRHIVVHCHHGRRSLTATYILRAAGFTNVTSLAGGIHLWTHDIDPSLATY